MPHNPVPPLPPLMNTRWPAWRFAWSTRHIQLVKPVSPTDPEASKLRCGGFGKTSGGVATMYSAREP